MESYSSGDRLSSENWPRRPRKYSKVAHQALIGNERLTLIEKPAIRGVASPMQWGAANEPYGRPARGLMGTRRRGAGARAPCPSPRFAAGGQEMVQLWRVWHPLAVWSLMAAALLLITAYGGTWCQAGAGAAEMAGGSNALIGMLEGPEIITDPAKFPKTFHEAPQLAELVKAGKL